MFKHVSFSAVLLVSILFSTAAAESAEETISWKTSWDEATRTADKSSKNILLLFTNPERCPPCRMMEEQTWPDRKVAAFVETNFVPLMIHTGRSKERSLGNEFVIQGIPTTLVIDTKKNVIAQKVGFSPPEEFLEFLKAVASLEELQKKVRIDAENITHTLDLAKAYIQLQRKADASRLLEKVCKFDEDNSNGKRVDALYLLGTIALENHDTKTAKKRFHEVTKLDPQGKTDYADDNALELAVLAANEGDFPSAVASLQEFLARFHKSELRPQAFIYLGRCHVETGHEDAARKAFEKLIKEYPDSRYTEYANRFLQNLKQIGGKGE